MVTSRSIPKTAKAKAAPAKARAAKADPATKGRKSYVSQADVPRYPINEALRVARAIADEYGKQPTRPLDVAAAMGAGPGRRLVQDAHRGVHRLRSHGGRCAGR